jgi:hypothetical protein
MVDESQSEKMTLPGLTEPLPMEWERQGDPSQQTTPVTALQTHPSANAHRRLDQPR